MKKILFTLALVVSFASFGQEWQFQKGGNAFDGFYRGATIFPVDNLYNIVLLNRGEELRLKWGLGGENTMDKLKIVIFTEGLVNPNSIKMSFDNERKVYDVDFFFNEEKSFYNLNEAYANNYSKLYNKFSIIDLFKKHNKVNFRISNGDKKIDFSFTLAGFTKTVNNVVLYNNSETDEKLNTIALIRLMGLIPGDVSTKDVFTNCLDFLNKFGKYYSNLVNSIELIIDKDLEEVSYLNRKAVAFSYFSKLIFKDKYGNFLKSIQGKDFLKGALQSSGNLKEYDDSKLIKDEESLRLLYEIVSQEDNWLSLPKLYEEVGFITNGVFSSNEEYLSFIESASIEDIFFFIEEGTFTDLTQFKNFLGVGLKDVSFEDFVQLSKEMIFKYYSFSISQRKIRVHFSDSDEGSLDIISLETFSEPWGNFSTN